MDVNQIVFFNFKTFILYELRKHFYCVILYLTTVSVLKGGSLWDMVQN